MSKGNIILLTMSIIIAMILTILPLPHWAIAFRPGWILLVLVFWVAILRNNIGLIIAWVSGLGVDLLTDSKLGQHAFALTIICYLIIRMHKQFVTYSLRKQSLIVALFSILYMAINLWILGLQGKSPGKLSYWAPVLSNALIWPWIFVFLREFRRNLKNKYPN